MVISAVAVPFGFLDATNDWHRGTDPWAIAAAGSFLAVLARSGIAIAAALHARRLALSTGFGATVAAHPAAWWPAPRLDAGASSLPGDLGGGIATVGTGAITGIAPVDDPTHGS